MIERMRRNMNNEKEMKGFLKGKLRSVKSLHAFYYLVLTIKNNYYKASRNNKGKQERNRVEKGYQPSCW